MSRGEIKIVGLGELRRDLRPFLADDEGKAQLMRANATVADFVIAKARALADDVLQRKAAATLAPSKRTDGVYVIGGSRDVPYFGGANFGSYRDTLRIIKAPRTKGRRGRATLVRADEEWRLEKIVRKIEQQSVTRSGKTVGRREAGARQVKVARTAGGGVRTIRGWNQFKPWSKGKDYMLYAGIRANIDGIVAIYYREIERLTRAAFPE